MEDLYQNINQNINQSNKNDLQRLAESIRRVKDGILDLLLSAGFVTGIVLFIIGLVFAIIEIGQFYKVYKIKSWPTFKNAGTIVGSYLETKSEQESYINIVLSNYSAVIYYRARFAFTYTINGVEYISYKYSYHEPWEINPMVPKYDIDFFDVGKSVDIIVNPDNPAEAYLTNKSYNTVDPIAVGSMIMFLGLLIARRSK